MVRLLEVQRHDLAVPLDERWLEIRGWLKQSAGTTSTELRVPKPIRKDLAALVECRNKVVHESYRTYVVARDNRGQRAVDEWSAWFGAQTDKLGPAYNAVTSLTTALRAESLDDEGLIRVWREWAPEPVRVFTWPDVSSP